MFTKKEVLKVFGIPSGYTYMKEWKEEAPATVRKYKAGTYAKKDLYYITIDTKNHFFNIHRVLYADRFINKYSLKMVYIPYAPATYDFGRFLVQVKYKQ